MVLDRHGNRHAQDGKFAEKAGSPPEFSLTSQQGAQDARRRLVSQLGAELKIRRSVYVADPTTRNEDAMFAAEYRQQESVIERDKMDVETLDVLTDALTAIEVGSAVGESGIPDSPVSLPDFAQRFGEAATRKAGARLTELTRLANTRPELRELIITSRTQAENREDAVHGLAEKLHGGFELADLMYDARTVGGDRLVKQARRQAVEALYEGEAGFVEDFRRTHFTGHEHTIEREREALGTRYAPYFDTWS